MGPRVSLDQNEGAARPLEGKVLRHWAVPPENVSAWWLLERAVALLDYLMKEPPRKALVYFPPEGATLLQVEYAALYAALDKTHWVQKKAAKFLGITEAMMSRRMVKHNLYAETLFGQRRNKSNRISRWEKARRTQAEGKESA